MEQFICPDCGSEASKVIACGLPIILCDDEECSAIWGFWSALYFYVIAPMEGLFSNSFTFMTYKGSYLKALWYWLTIDFSK